MRLKIRCDGESENFYNFFGTKQGLLIPTSIYIHILSEVSFGPISKVYILVFDSIQV